MVKLELELSDIDYQKLLETVQSKLGGQMPAALGGLGSSLLMMASDSVKDRLAAELINANAARLADRLEAIASANGLPVRVSNLRANAKNE